MTEADEMGEDSADDGSEGEPAEDPTCYIEIFDHDIYLDNVVLSPPKLISIGGCITPNVEKLLLPPVPGCRLQRREADKEYQAWFPVIDGPKSHSRRWGTVIRGFPISS